MWLTGALFVIFFVGIVEITTKFSQEMFAKMKGKMKEPLSSTGQKRPKASEKKTAEKTSSAPIIQQPRTVSPTISLEELTPRPKKGKSSDKENDKVRANVWEDVATALGRAYNIMTPDELKELS